MLYWIKTGYAFLFPPGCLIVLFLAAGLWLLIRGKRPAGFMLTAGGLLLYLAAAPFVGEHLLQTLEKKYQPPQQIQGDVYVVLTGGGIAGTPDVDGSGNPSGYTLQRVVAAARLYAKHPLPVLISGGLVYDDMGNEGQLARRKLIALGVPEKDVFVDDRSRNTKENAQNSKVILEAQHWRKPVLITSAFHMARAVKHFRDQEVEAQPYPVDYLISPLESVAGRGWAPSANAMDKLALALKEYAGMLQ